MQFLPSQIDGIWHTGIVVFGTEYYFGGGIQAGPPGQTHFGRPMQVVDLGSTQVPKELFLEFLEGVTSQFSFETYDLMSNNCNTFSNAAAEFLCGKGIPGHIVNLPNEVLSSPLAPMLTPLLSQMSSARARERASCVATPTVGVCCSERAEKLHAKSVTSPLCVCCSPCFRSGSLRVTEGGPAVPPVSPFGHRPAAPAAAPPPVQAPAAAPAAPEAAPAPAAAAAAAAAAARSHDRDVAAHGGTPAHDTGAAAAPSAAAAGAPPAAEKDDEAKRAAFKKAVAAEFARLRAEKPEIPASEAAADAVAAVLLRVEAGEDL